MSNNQKRANSLEELRLFKEKIISNRENVIGVPANLSTNYQEIFQFCDLFLNNIGDVFIERKRGFSTRTFEREVLNFFANLYQLPNHWGYVTSGSTEGNLYGLWLGREHYPDGLLYYSEESHYSIPKIAQLLRMKAIVVRSSQNGEINYKNLEETITRNCDKPVILNLNIGTTMKGAIDNIASVGWVER